MKFRYAYILSNTTILVEILRADQSASGRVVLSFLSFGSVLSFLSIPALTIFFQMVSKPISSRESLIARFTNKLCFAMYLTQMAFQLVLPLKRFLLSTAPRYKAIVGRMDSRLFRDCETRPKFFSSIHLEFSIARYRWALAWESWPGGLPHGMFNSESTVFRCAE